jgi:hypothetical protein
MDFNSSVWHAFWILIPLGVAVFLWSFCSLKGDWYFFDPKHNEDQKLKDAGDFEEHSKRYQDLAKLVVTLSAAAVGFLISVLTGEPTKSPVGSAIRAVLPIVIGFFGACIALLIAWMLSQTYWYEEYCHSPDHNSYKRWKYALNVSLGWTGLLSFVLGFGWLAHNLFK